MQLGQTVHLHPYLTTSVATWLFNNVVSAAISSLPAPTKSSSAGYVWLFKFSNSVIGNVQRAKSTTLESSPNWQDAVKKINGQSASQPLDNTQQPPAQPPTGGTGNA